MSDSLKCYEVVLSFDYTRPADEKRVECRIIRQNRGVGVVAPDLEEALRLARDVMEAEGKQNIEIYQARMLHVVDAIFQRWTSAEIDKMHWDAIELGKQLKELETNDNGPT